MFSALMGAITQDVGAQRQIYENRQTEMRARNSQDFWNYRTEARQDNQYQRSANDLESAGLNRILALGDGAPSGGTQGNIHGAPSPT